MVPELRAQRLLQIAARVRDDFGGDLSAALTGSLEKVRRVLKAFPNIADPGADRILLFARLSAIAAVPSNCPQVLVRIQLGLERENYGVTYKEAQRLIDAEVPAGFEARMRAYLLLKRHGQELCKRTKPLCGKCPLSADCRYAAGANRGRNRP
jgi:endonuclease III